MTCDIYSSGRRGGERRARAVNQVSNMYRKKRNLCPPPEINFLSFSARERGKRRP